MEWWQAIILGLVQGATEVLPISSTAHLVLFDRILGASEEGVSTLSFDVLMNFASWLAVMIYLKEAWLDMVVGILNYAKININIFLQNKAWKKYVPGFHDMTVQYQRNDFYFSSEKQVKLALLLILGTIPAGLVGFFFSEQIDVYLRTPLVIAWALILGGVLLWVADHFSRHTKELKNMKWWEALFIGVGQVAALIPGFSRSGSTITTGLFIGFSRKDIATFSFLLGAPIVLAATIFTLPDFIEIYQFSFSSLAAFIASFIATLFSLHLFYKFIENRSYLAFVVYRLLLGVIILGVQFYF